MKANSNNLQLKLEKVGTNPIIMGIINVTPDSFYAPSRMPMADSARHQIDVMLQENVDIIDIGGQSTRPTSQLLSCDTEKKRLLPLFELIAKNYPQLLWSIDTFYADIAIEAIAHGASIVNDVSAGGIDDQLLSTVAQANVYYVIMHNKKKLLNTVVDATAAVPSNYASTVLHELQERIAACHQLGIAKIIIDLGFGFNKNNKQNFCLLKNLQLFKQLNCPILVGLSRKRLVYETLKITIEESLPATSALHLYALQQGANILRVHDVQAAKNCVTLWEELKSMN
ncbi:MAG: dihydropteroate synthase [Phycisphaerales bacterium]|nr:dihydropteroate synthase [Phycisphaerales bacterium]